MMNTSLTSGRGFGNSDVPQTKQGVTDAFPVPHTVEKSGLFCFVSNIATGISCGRCYILTEHVPMIVRLGRPCFGRGACSVFFYASIPKQSRCHMLRFFLSSRYLRLRHRLLSLLTTLAGRAGATLALGALLMLPAVYLWEVL